MYLLDTNLVWWTAVSPDRLSRRALALVEGLTLLTSDRLLARYGKMVKWV
ncbi:MAG: hypothetical protein ACKO8N_09170 [Rubrivivax sp.]